MARTLDVASTTSDGGRDPVRIMRIIARLNVGGPAIHATLLTERLDVSRYHTTLVAGTEEPGEESYLRLQGRTLPQLVTLQGFGREIRRREDVSGSGPWSA